MVTERIIAYLTKRGWRLAKDESLFVYLSAPEEFGLPQEYSLIVPKTTDHSDFKRYYNNLLEIFADFYNLSKIDFDTLLGTADTILKVRINDKETADGKMNFVRFEGFIERLKAIITDTASFVIDRNLTSSRIPAEAHLYLNKCNFLQTEIGSYITKIQLPSKVLIKDSELLGRGQVYAEEINEKLIDVLEYVNNQIFTNNVGPITDDYILENEDKLNLKLLKDIETFYDKSELKNVEFSLHSIKDTKVVESENITKEQINRLSVFIQEVGSRTFETKEVTVKGKIERLQSKDPDGNRNAITMPGLLADLPVLAKASLASDDYKLAIEAHRIKEYVTITGLAKVSKTRVSFIRIDSFNLG